MAKYKLLNSSELMSSFWVADQIYDGDLRRNPMWLSVKEMAASYPRKWELIQEKSPEELLIEEAKIRYPIGTKFIPIMRGPGKSFETIKNLPFLTENGGFIQDGPGGCSIYRAYDKKWAEIIKKEPMCTEKTIIGYKLKDNLWENDYRKQSFIEGVCSIGVIHGSKTITNIEESTNPRCPAVLENFKAAKVLDLWFIPVYKSEYPDITINGYKGEFFDNYVKFGCAEIHKAVFIGINQINKDLRNGEIEIGKNSNRSIESITIGKGTFTKDQIKEIAEYYLNK